MKLDHTEEQQMIQAMAREFAETAIKPIAAEIDREARFPHETVKRMGELGLMGIAIPETWGGSGADTVSYVVAVEEIAKACGSHAAIMSVNNSLYCDPVYTFGTDTQRERFLRPVASGHAHGCFALTEPQAGSDASNQHTLAVRDNDHYVLNGRQQSGGARRWTRRHRRPGRRACGGRPRALARLRARAEVLRRGDRPAPDGPVDARRHGDRRRWRPAPDPARRRAQGRGQAIRDRRGDGEALRRRDRDEGDHGRDSGPRRLRLREGVRGGALLPRREDHPDLRGDLADPEARDRARRAGRHPMSERERWKREAYEPFARRTPERPVPFESLSGL